MVERRGGFLPAACSAALLCALGACSTDTSGLELRRPGSAGAAVTGDNGAGGSPAPSEAPAPPLDPMDTPPSDEPPRLALLHGIVDGGELWSCRGNAAEPPWPPTGIAY